MAWIACSCSAPGCKCGRQAFVEGTACSRCSSGTHSDSVVKASEKPGSATVLPFVSHALPKWWPYAPRHDEKGRCVFNSRREAEEACARARGDGEEVRYLPKAELAE